MPVQVTYGNCEGQYFIPGHFDELLWLLNMIHEGPVPEHCERVEVTEAEIWYDRNEDFHRLKFKARGHEVAVRLYKVFAATIDGADYGITWRLSAAWDLAVGIRERLGVRRFKLHADPPAATGG